MNFDFSEEQKLLQKTVRDYLAEHCPLPVVREVLESSQPYASELWKGAAQLGWLGAVIPEEFGGAGFGYLELALIAEEIGRSLAPIPFGPSVTLASEAILRAGSPAQRQAYLPALASGERVGTLALAEKPGDPTLRQLGTTWADGRLNGRKVPVLDGDVAGFAVVAARAVDGVCLVLVDLDESGVTRESIHSFDPTRSQARLEFENVRGERLAGDGEALIASLLDRAAVLCAFEQLGGAERAFEITREFVLARYAFGRPIGSFQAIKHRLADLYCEIELARSNAYYGAWALSHDAPELAVAAPTARVSATTAFELAAKEMIQFHGGVGFTWEYDCHLFYRRSKLLGLWLGSARQWRDTLVRRLDAVRAD